MASLRRSRRRRAARAGSASGKRPPNGKPSPLILSAIPLKIQQRLLEMISASIENGRTPDEVARVCLRVFLELTEAQSAAVYLLDEIRRDMRCLAIEGKSTAAPPEWDDAVARVVKTGRLVTGPDLFAFPLKRSRHLEGVLLVQGLPEQKKKSDEVVDLLDFVASRLAVGLDHSRLAHKYAQKIVRIQQLEEVSAILNSALDDIQAQRQAVEAATKLVDAEAGSLLLLSPENGELVIHVAVGGKAELVEGVRLPAGQGIAGVVSQTGEPVIVNDAQHDTRVAKQVDERTGFRTRNILAVPIRSHNKVLGVMEAVNKRDGQFSNWDLIEFGSLANQLAISLENSQLFRDYKGKILRLRKLQEISRVLNSSLNQTEIRKRAIEAITLLLDAEAGSLLLLDEAAGELYFDVALGEKGEGVRQIRLKVGAGIAGYVAKTGEPEIINDCYNDSRFNREADKKSGFKTRNMVCVPVKARDKLLGVLQAINKKDGGLFGEDDLQDFVSLGHQVGIAIENANLYEEINRLLEGFISASVTAIESRDPTTSGHSERVAVLTCSLAEVVDRLDDGPFASTKFGYDEIKEIRYAAVLHDFGKVGVRENVLVKADKLFPGDLAILKSRFDFIKRTWEVQALRRKVDLLLSGDRDSAVSVLAEVDEDLAKRIAETDGILEFLLACNRPTVLPTGGFERLHDIAQLRYEGFGDQRPFLLADEVIKLSVPKGSLTAEERIEIESHVTHTYRFLSQIPWTKSLSNVPLIAYGHHEKLDGTGYPRQTPATSIPVQTRMMTISDIYDALTAADRPYKAAVSTQKALDIIEYEVKHGKVDQELFKVFVEAKVYLKVHDTK